jgi:hypothetical protein
MPIRPRPAGPALAGRLQDGQDRPVVEAREKGATRMDTGTSASVNSSMTRRRREGRAVHGPSAPASSSSALVGEAAAPTRFRSTLSPSRSVSRRMRPDLGTKETRFGCRRDRGEDRADERTSSARRVHRAVTVTGSPRPDVGTLRRDCVIALPLTQRTACRFLAQLTPTRWTTSASATPVTTKRSTGS